MNAIITVHANPWCEIKGDVRKQHQGKFLGSFKSPFVPRAGERLSFADDEWTIDQVKWSVRDNPVVHCDEVYITLLVNKY